MTEWYQAPGTEPAAAYRRNDVSPEAVPRVCLDRMDTVNPLLNAVIAQDRATGSADAAASTARWRAGQPLEPGIDPICLQ